MPRERKPGAPIGSAEWRRRVSEGTKYGLAKRRQLALVLPTDLVFLQQSGTIAKALLPFFDAAQLEAAELVLAYEGEAGTPNHRTMSAPRKALLDDYVRAGVFMRGELARYAQSQDMDAGSRAITAMGRRSAILEKLGLDHVENEVPDLPAYIASKEREKAASDEIATTPDSAPAATSPGVPAANEGGAGESTCSLSPTVALNPPPNPAIAGE